MMFDQKKKIQSMMSFRFFLFFVLEAVSNVEEDTFVDSLDDSDKEVDETQVVESPSELSRDSKSSVRSPKHAWMG